MLGTSFGFSVRGGGNDTQGFVIFLTVPCCAAPSAVIAALCVAAEASALVVLEACALVNFVAFIATEQHVSEM
jgi:hypothetical protein